MENHQALFLEAGTLMLAGMIFVFAFLGLLIVFINVVLVKLAKKYPDTIVKSRPTSKKNNNKTDGSINPAVVAAISAAVSQYRQQQSTQK
ncbi:oxaloacetate decarboxylase, gamma subunit [Colwellia chukchiensis]|uniref:Probable oxaloacetate decarboxylase gamma chain n=1 Tax=Colwellia chukchiensis TaxID=641665 RepID=A0A1H7ISZ8_9GAMM|nr:OadG family transporter subunit [Colwellia chukchiensis]SEK64837.1 oxaloacetate decarboxylase, gamma subunit [Colwellia chukchiensis]